MLVWLSTNDKNKYLTLLLYPFNSHFFRTTWVSRYQKGRTILDFNEARDDGWQWHQLDHMQVISTLRWNRIRFLQQPGTCSTSFLQYLSFFWYKFFGHLKKIMNEVLLKPHWPIVALISITVTFSQTPVCFKAYVLFVDDLLPLIHSVWMPFVNRFSDEEPLVTIKVILYFCILMLFKI